MFGPAISFKSMVSLRFSGNGVITQSSLLPTYVFHGRKVTRLTIEEAMIDMDYVKAIETAIGL